MNHSKPLPFIWVYSTYRPGGMPNVPIMLVRGEDLEKANGNLFAGDDLLCIPVEFEVGWFHHDELNKINHLLPPNCRYWWVGRKYWNVAGELNEPL